MIPAHPANGAHVAGHRRRRDGLAARRDRDGAGRRSHPDQRALADVDCGRHVSAFSIDLGGLRRRAHRLVAQPVARRAQRVRRGADAGGARCVGGEPLATSQVRAREARPRWRHIHNKRPP